MKNRRGRGRFSRENTRKKSIETERIFRAIYVKSLIKFFSWLFPALSLVFFSLFFFSSVFLSLKTKELCSVPLGQPHSGHHSATYIPFHHHCKLPLNPRNASIISGEEAAANGTTCNVTESFPTTTPATTSHHFRRDIDHKNHLDLLYPKV